MLDKGRGIFNLLFSLFLVVRNMVKIKMFTPFKALDVNFSITSRNPFGFSIAIINIIPKSINDIKLEIHFLPVFTFFWDSSVYFNEKHFGKLDSTMPQIV